MDPAPASPPASPQPRRRNWWQRNWKWFVPTGCLTMLALFFAFVAVIVIVVFGAMKSSDAYQIAVKRAESDPRVTSALGTPIKEGWYLTGKTNVTGGSGDADLSIPISGPKSGGTLYAVAKKSAGKWHFSTLQVHVDKNDETIDLAGNPAR